MNILELQSIVVTPNGIDVFGVYDPGAEDVSLLKVRYRLSEENRGNVSGTQRGPEGVIRIVSPNHNLRNGDRITVFGVRGTVEANGDWAVQRVAPDTFDLRRSTFQTAYADRGEWFITATYDRQAIIDGEPPPTPWSCSINLPRRGVYEVQGVLYWTGSPSVIQSTPMSVAFP